MNLNFRFRMFIAKLLHLSFLLCFVSTETHALTCQEFAFTLQEKANLTAELINDAYNFAEQNKLPYQILDVGPAELERKRLFVAIDMTNKELMDKYMSTYNFDSPRGTAEGFIALEFEKDRSDYVSGVLRTSAKREDLIWRWARQTAPENRDPRNWDQWIQWCKDRHQIGDIFGFAHIIPISKAQKQNVDYYLKAPKEERGDCKGGDSNCVAWTSSIELGKTGRGIPVDQRIPLFNYLGVARSSAHFEIGRRLVHAANEHHGVIFVMVVGEAGYQKFRENLKGELPPDPQIPYRDIIRGVELRNPEAVNAMSVIPEDAKVFIPVAAGASPDGFSALIERAMGMQKGVDVTVLVNGISENAFIKAFDKARDKFRMNALFLGSNLRQLQKKNGVNIIPGNLSDFTRWMKEGEPAFQYDAIIVRVSEPVNGLYSLGPNHDQIMTIIRNRPGIKVIAEVNKNIPFTTGDNTLKAEDITVKFKSTSALAGPAVAPVTPEEKAIAQNLATLIPEGATMQIGIGNLFGGLPDALAAKGARGIKMHTEMLGDTGMKMVQSGVVDDVVTGFAYGTTDLYKWLNLNTKVKFVSTEFVNDPGRVQQIPKFHAINTALQVSLNGETNATIGADGYQMSSPGGQVEFMSGASRSAGGKGIIAIRSTAKNNSISTIVLDLYPGPGTTPGEMVSHVVTEHGVAQLRGKSIRDRALALIRVAHPNFRKDLAQQALKRSLIRPGDENEF